MIHFKIKIDKATVEELRYGRTPIAGKLVRAPLPLFAPITKEWFLNGTLLIEVNSKQILVPNDVNDSNDRYEITGQLIFKEGMEQDASEEAMLVYFIKNSEYKYIKHSSTLFELQGCSLMLNFGNSLKNPTKNTASTSSREGLFKKAGSTEETKAKLALLTEMISPFFNDQPPVWKYNKGADTAFICCSDENLLKTIYENFLTMGTPPEYAELSKTKIGLMPILLIRNVSALKITSSNANKTENVNEATSAHPQGASH